MPTNRPAMKATITTTIAVVRVLLGGGEVEGVSVNGDLQGIGSHRLDGVGRLADVLDPGHAERGDDAQRSKRNGDRPEPARQHLRHARLVVNAIANSRRQPRPQHAVARLVAKLRAVLAQFVEKSVFSHGYPHRGRQGARATSRAPVKDANALCPRSSWSSPRSPHARSSPPETVARRSAACPEATRWPRRFSAPARW